MSTLDVCDFPIETAIRPAAPSKQRFATALVERWSAWRQKHTERRALDRLRHLDTRILIDMGFDPAAIYASRVGTWREEHGDAWKAIK